MIEQGSPSTQDIDAVSQIFKISLVREVARHEEGKHYHVARSVGDAWVESLFLDTAAP